MAVDDDLEKMKKVCECDNCGYQIRIFPGIKCPSCPNGKMIKRIYYICYICGNAEKAILGNNCLNCRVKKTKILFQKN